MGLREAEVRAVFAQRDGGRCVESRDWRRAVRAERNVKQNGAPVRRRTVTSSVVPCSQSEKEDLKLEVEFEARGSGVNCVRAAAG